MQLLIVLIITAVALLGITNLAHHPTNVDTSPEHITTITPTLMPGITTFTQSPTSILYITPTSSVVMPTLQPMTLPGPTSQPPQDAVNLQKTQALQGIDDKINSIDQTIANLKSDINDWLKQQDRCHQSVTPGCTPFPTPPGPRADSGYEVPLPSCMLIDPLIEMQAETDCVMGITSTINNISSQIKSLTNEKSELDRDKIAILSQ